MMITVVMCLQMVDAMQGAERIISPRRFLHKSAPRLQNVLQHDVTIPVSLKDALCEHSYRNYRTIKSMVQIERRWWEIFGSIEIVARFSYRRSASDARSNSCCSITFT